MKILKVYISLLRGINVGGKNIIKMIDLKEVYESLKFENVKTYIQSGNVVFCAEEIHVQKIKNKISKAIGKKFNLNVSVLVKTINEFEKIINNHPFDEHLHIKQSNIVYLFEKPYDILYKEINTLKKDSEKIVFGKDIVYCLYLEGQATTKLTLKVFEKKLHTLATIRNFRTSTTLLTLAKEIYASL